LKTGPPLATLDGASLYRLLRPPPWWTILVLQCHQRRDHPWTVRANNRTIE